MKTEFTKIERYDPAVYDKALAALYQNHLPHDKATFVERLDYFSQLFLGQPYVCGALGEGPNGAFDQNPCFRFDAFDCVTYVNTVIALALSDDADHFQQNLIQLNYATPNVSYLNRLHFVEVDWHPKMQQHGWLRDVTDTFQNAHHRPIHRLAEAQINRPGWIAKKTLSDLKLFADTQETEAHSRLATLHASQSQFHIAFSTLPYLPFDALIDEQGQAKEAVFSKIPNAAIIEIVRPNWDLEKTIGTHLNISHMGFAFRDHTNTVLFRNASSVHQKVVAEPLAQYLFHQVKSPTIRGINIQCFTPDPPAPSP